MPERRDKPLTLGHPFEHRSGFAVGQTIPVTPKPGNLWAGYLLRSPRFEPAEFNPLPIDVGIGDDWIFFAEELGLKEDELQRAIEIGGPKFAETFTSGTADLTIDADRPSLLDGQA